MSIGEVEIHGHMDGFDQGGQAVDRPSKQQLAQSEVRNLAHDALAIILAQVKERSSEPFTKALGRKAFGDAESAVLSEARFRRSGAVSSPCRP